MSVHEQILEATRRLAAAQPPDSISLADVAREAGVSWPTVRRHLGGKARLRELLAAERTETTPADVDTRGRILRAASHVFARHGFNGATMDDVAAEAGLTKGAIYWHFASKSELFLALLEEGMGRQYAQLPALVDSMTGMDRLAAILAESFVACKEQQDWPRLLLEFSVSARDTAVRERVRELYRLGDEIGSEATRKAQAEGRMAADVDPRAISLLISALLRGLLMTWVIDPGSMETEELIPKLAQVLWQGIQPAKP